MQQLLIGFALAAIFVLANTSTGQTTALASEDYCVVPVEDGRPTEADLGDVHRMVSWVDRIPHLNQIYIQPLNRGGRWTVDQEGRFRPFDGLFPTRGLSVQRQWIVDGTGRVIGGNPTDLFVIDPPSNTFRHLMSLGDHGHLGEFKFEPHSGRLYVRTSKDLYELRGETLTYSPYAAEARKFGLKRLFPPHYLPSIAAHLFETEDGRFALRYEADNWQVIHTLQCRIRCRSYRPEVVQLEDEDLVAIRTAKEVFFIDINQRTAPRVTEVYQSDGNIRRQSMRFSPETNSILTYHAELFLRLAEDAAVPTVESSDSWLLQITRQGVHPVPGHRIVPRQLERSSSRSDYWTHSQDLPGRGQVLVWAADGLVLFDGKTSRLIPDSGPLRLGLSIRAFTLESLDRVFIASTLGLYELTHDNNLVAVETPFDASGPPFPEFIDAPHLNAAVVLSNNGVYILSADGTFQSVPGGESVKFGFLSEGLAVLPVTGDLLIQGLEALYLLRKAPCSR